MATKKEREAAAAAKKRSEASKKAAATRKANAEAAAAEAQAQEAAAAEAQAQAPEAEAQEDPPLVVQNVEDLPTGSDFDQSEDQSEGSIREIAQKFFREGGSFVDRHDHRADVNPGDQARQADQRQAELEAERLEHNVRTSGFKY